jgi:hypothetical protein
MKRLAALIMSIGILTLIITSIMDSGSAPKRQARPQQQLSDIFQAPATGSRQTLQTNERLLESPNPQSEEVVKTTPRTHDTISEPKTKEEIALEAEINELLDEEESNNTKDIVNGNSYQPTQLKRNGTPTRRYNKEDEWAMTASALEDLDAMDSMSSY